MLRWLALAGLVAGLVAGIAGWKFNNLLEPRSAEAPLTTFTVERGWGVRRVAHELEIGGLIKSAPGFRWLARAERQAEQLKAGEYDLSAAWSARTILARLVSGRVKNHAIVVPEGWRASEIAARLDESGIADGGEFLAAVRDPALAASLGVEGDSLEGYLYPETYYFPRGIAGREVARIMAAQFLEAWREIEPKAKERGMTMLQVVTLASVVEKETGAEEERPLIAAVFHNRLHKRMRLESDPTVIYGIADFDGNIKRSHLRDATNPYNTYLIPGLPPGPIASPGIDALRSAVAPADSQYLYFVSQNDGTHFFSSNYRDHVNAVNRYQRRRWSAK